MTHPMVLRLLLLCVGLGQGALAQAEAQASLAPLRAVYGMSVAFFPLGNVEFVLEPAEAADNYRVEVKARLMGMRNTETSAFEWNACEPRTHSYRHEFRGLGMRRHHDMTFSWDDPPQVVNVGHDETKTYDIPPGTLDEITLLLKARCLFSEGATRYTATTAYGNRIRTHDLRLAGTETIKVPFGRIETVRVEKVHKEESDRRTTIWVAPELDYMMVRARHTEGGISGNVVLREYEGPRRAQLEPMARAAMD